MYMYTPSFNKPKLVTVHCMFFAEQAHTYSQVHTCTCTVGPLNNRYIEIDHFVEGLEVKSCIYMYMYIEGKML